MNGVALEEDDIVIDRRPIISCAGELEVFSALEDNLTKSLPQDASEWKRSLGRPIKYVHIGANFTPFSAVGLPKGNQWDIIRHPLFHVYWTECNDLDTYKATLKEDIENWLKELSAKDIHDWLIVVVENYDGRRSNKLLPRTTVLDKIRTDFATKQGDRCISVINPGKQESRTTESWKGLVARIRHLLLVAYAKAVSRLEDHVRQQREKRTEPGWNFMNYLNLHEELAQVLEMLGLHDEALLQYDELDALFSQFVVNSFTCESISWPSNFQKPLERWHGLKLGPCKLPKNPSLLELRSYLFAKQAHMLLLMNKIWEMASRCLPFLYTCTRELQTLEVTAPAGALASWQFLVAMEVLHICDKFNHADEVASYSLHTAGLWAYASQKLRFLGELCGLLPGSLPTSEQLHIVVGLSAGMGDNPGSPNAPSPTDKLKEALCSQEVFNKTYLELAELALGTYKHTNRLRFARLVGRELASFYVLLGETQKAAAFLGDALRTFQQNGWQELAAQSHLELADCHRMGQTDADIRKYVKACAHVSAALDMDTLIRWSYFDGMKKAVEKLEKPLMVAFDEIIRIVSVSIKNESVSYDTEDEVYPNGSVVIMQHTKINVELVIESNFPREILCDRAAISLEDDSKDSDSNNPDKYCSGKLLTDKDLKMKDPALRRLKIQRHLDYKQDKQLAVACVVCKHSESKRKDSSAPPPLQSEFNFCLELDNLPLLLTPGINVIKLTRTADQIGKYFLGQIGIYMGQFHLLSPMLVPRLAIEIKEEGPSVGLYRGPSPLLSGVEQYMNLVYTVGSYKVEPTWKIRLTASPGLQFQVDKDKPLVNNLEVETGDRECFTSTRTRLRVFADMLSSNHQVSISCPWSTKPLVVDLSFSSPLTAVWKLHTIKHRKYVQVILSGQCQCLLELSQPKLKLSNGYKCLDLNRSLDLVPLSNGQSITFMWELMITTNAEAPPIKAVFNAFYKIEHFQCSDKLYQFFFDISDYQTLYMLEANVEPAKGSEFCRVGILCHLNLCIKSVGQLESAQQMQSRSLMYEVVAEQSIWAVCGRTAGVVSFDVDFEPQTVVLDVMPLTSGYLPLPLIRLSKYIPAELTEKSGKGDSHPRLEIFSSGQVFNSSKGKQVHVIGAANDGHIT